jgi:hypothetical protein
LTGRGVVVGVPEDWANRIAGSNRIIMARYFFTVHPPAEVNNYQEYTIIVKKSSIQLWRSIFFGQRFLRANQREFRLAGDFHSERERAVCVSAGIKKAPSGAVDHVTVHAMTAHWQLYSAYPVTEMCGSDSVQKQFHDFFHCLSPCFKSNLPGDTWSQL